MAEVVVFHHARGPTEAVRRFAGSELYFAERDEQAAALLTERVLDFLEAIPA